MGYEISIDSIKKDMQKGSQIEANSTILTNFLIISFVFCCKIELFQYQLMKLMLVVNENAKIIDFLVLPLTWVEKLRLTLRLFLNEKCNLFLRIKNMI